MKHYREGSSFEQSIARLFERAGFKVKLNSRDYGFEIDVLAEKLGKTICVECKDRRYTNVGALIYEWDSKGNRSGINKAVLAIGGEEVSDENIYYAKRLGVAVWDRKEINRLSLLDNKQLSNELNYILKLSFGSYVKHIFSHILNSIFKVILFLLFAFALLYYGFYLFKYFRGGI